MAVTEPLEPNLGVAFEDLSKGVALAEILKLPAAPYAIAASAHRQFDYIEKYVRRPDLGILDGAADSESRSILVENHYIDRDYIEDHSAFYSKNVHPYPNHCRRVHFFAMTKAELKQSLNQLAIANAKPSRGSTSDDRADLENRYIGFCVIKPLDGTPVGRTVLRPLKQSGPNDRYARSFEGTRDYTVHVLGVELSIQGLAFQQQDVGVSACATTALWSSLHKIHDHEHVTLATPAQITALACQYSLPFGRPMPSEGLSLDQMCQAVHALGLAPDLIPVRGKAETARSIIHSAVNSGFAPVLLLKYPDNSGHAVCVVGEKLSPGKQAGSSCDTPGGAKFPYVDDSENLAGVYFHDDRLGPYLVGDIQGRGSAVPKLSFEYDAPNGVKTDNPEITHLLIPIHHKVRLSFLPLREIAIQATVDALIFADEVDADLATRTLAGNPPRVRTWIQKSHRYVESLVRNSGLTNPSSLLEQWACLRVPRYCGIVRTNILGNTYDIVIDCTSTRRNPNFVATVGHANTLAEAFSRELARRMKCPAIVTS